MYSSFNKSEKETPEEALAKLTAKFEVKYKGMSRNKLQKFLGIPIIESTPFLQNPILTYPGTVKMAIDPRTLREEASPDRLSKEGVEKWLNNVSPISTERFSSYDELAENYHLTLQAAQILLTELNAQTKYMKKLEKLNDKLMGNQI